MRFSIVRSGAATLAAAVLLAACSGRALIPSEGPSSVAGSYAVPLATNPCYTHAVQPAWIFKGSCVTTKLSSKGAKLTLPPYKGITVGVALPKNNSKKNPFFALVDALGGKHKDISRFKGMTFPPVTPKTLKPVIYVQAVNGYNGLKFTSGNLVFTVKAAKFPGSSCPLSLITGKFPKLKWFNSPFNGKISGGTMTFTIPGSALGTLFPNGLPAGPLYFNVGCK